jgi:hypothetical protein
MRKASDKPTINIIFCVSPGLQCNQTVVSDGQQVLSDFKRTHGQGRPTVLLLKTG